MSSSSLAIAILGTFLIGQTAGTDVQFFVSRTGYTDSACTTEGDSYQEKWSVEGTATSPSQIIPLDVCTQTAAGQSVMRSASGTTATESTYSTTDCSGTSTDDTVTLNTCAVVSDSTPEVYEKSEAVSASATVTYNEYTDSTCTDANKAPAGAGVYTIPIGVCLKNYGGNTSSRYECSTATTISYKLYTSADCSGVSQDMHSGEVGTCMANGISAGSSGASTYHIKYVNATGCPFSTGGGGSVNSTPRIQTFSAVILLASLLAFITRS